MPTRERKRNRFPAEILPKNLRCLGPSLAFNPVHPTSLLLPAPSFLGDGGRKREREKWRNREEGKRESKAKSHYKAPDLGLRDGRRRWNRLREESCEVSGENYLLLRPGQLPVAPSVSQESRRVQLQQL